MDHQEKNIICEEAQYENLVVMHDRISFAPGWYDRMKRYGNYLTLSVLYKCSRVLICNSWTGGLVMKA